MNWYIKWKIHIKVKYIEPITSSNLLTSLDKRLTICPVVVLASAVLLRQRAFAEHNKMSSYEDNNVTGYITHTCFIVD